MKSILKLSFLLLVAMLLAVPLVHATSIVNIAGLDTPVSITDISSPSPNPEHWYTQSFTTLGDGLNLTVIALPLTRYTNTAPGNLSYAPGVITVQIRPVTTYGQINLALFPIISVTTDPGLLVPVSNSSLDIYWILINITATQLAPGTTYALCVSAAWAPYNQTGFLWWANGNYGALGNTNYAYFYDAGSAVFEAMPTEDPDAVGNAFAFGFELVEGASPYIGVDVNAQLFLSLFLSLGMGLIGFAMTKGKEPLAAIFMIEFGVFISYMVGWAPAWVLAASIAVLGIMLAYKFRGALSHG